MFGRKSKNYKESSKLHKVSPDEEKLCLKRSTKRRSCESFQDHSLEISSKREDYAQEEPNLLKLEENDLSKDDGVFETSNFCLKAERALESLDTQCFKGQVGFNINCLSNLLLIY